MKKSAISIEPNSAQTIRMLKKRSFFGSNAGSKFLAMIKKALAVLMIFALAIADVFTLLELFGKLNSDDLHSGVYSLTFALCLEGIPTFLGICASGWSDKTTYKRNDLWISIIGFGVALGALIAAFSLAISLRYNLILSYGGEEAFRNGTYAANAATNWEPHLNSTYLKDCFLMFLPIVTSLLAFLVSWVTFPSNNHAQLERELDEMHAQLIDLQGEFRIARYTTEVAQTSLWKDLSGSDTNMPRTFNAFRKECYVRIRELLFRDCLEKYPHQIETYNNEIVRSLDNILKEMATRTNIPERINEIDIRKLLQQYDQEEEDPIKKWEAKACVTPLTDQLKRLLSNAIVVAQFKSTAGSSYKEGSNW